MAGVGIKLERFLGIQPKISSELLGATAAQVATNVKLYSGDLLPYPTPSVFTNQYTTANPVVLRGIRGFNNELKWLVFTNDVDLVDAGNSDLISISPLNTANPALVSEKRFYYTGEGTPRWSSYARMEAYWGTLLSTIPTADRNAWYNNGWYTVLQSNEISNYNPQYYELGLPLPTKADSPNFTAAEWPYGSLGQDGRNFIIARGADGVVGVVMLESGSTTVNFGTVGGFGYTLVYAATQYWFVVELPAYIRNSLAFGDSITISNATISGASATYLNGTGSVVGTSATSVTFILPAIGPIVSGTATFTLVKNGGTAIRPKHGFRQGASITLSNMGYIEGTYGFSSGVGSTTANVQVNNHGVVNQTQVQLTFTSGTLATTNSSGVYTATVTGSNTFTINVPAIPVDQGGIVRLELGHFNVQNAPITVINEYGFTFYKPGPQTNTITNTTGSITLGGVPTARTYVYTWYTPWGEESVPSTPTSTIFVRETASVFVSGFPTTSPAGRSDIQGVRLYRSVASAGGADYYLLKTLFLPNYATNIYRTGTAAKIRVFYPHNLLVNDRVRIRELPTSDLNIDAVVTDIIDPYTFTFTTTTSGSIAAQAVSTGRIFYDIAQNPITEDAVYYGSTDPGGISLGLFPDGTDPGDVSVLLRSQSYEPPPENLIGLTACQNEILAGFVDQEVYFSEVGKPHAWPSEYVIKLEHKIVTMIQAAGNLLVLTDGYPYLISGSDPASMNAQKIDSLYPCVSKRSVASLSIGILYASNDGLVLYNPGQSPVLLTKYAYNSETWEAALDPSTIIGAVYEDTYVAAHSAGGFAFEWDQQAPTFVKLTQDLNSLKAAWYDAISDKLYFAGPMV